MFVLCGVYETLRICVLYVYMYVCVCGGGGGLSVFVCCACIFVCVAEVRHDRAALDTSHLK